MADLDTVQKRLDELKRQRRAQFDEEIEALEWVAACLRALDRGDRLPDPPPPIARRIGPERRRYACGCPIAEGDPRRGEPTISICPVHGAGLSPDS